MFLLILALLNVESKSVNLMDHRFFLSRVMRRMNWQFFPNRSTPGKERKKRIDPSSTATLFFDMILI